MLGIPVLYTPPTEEPLTINDIRDFLRIDNTDSDMLLEAMITAARNWAEQVTGRALITQTWTYYLDDWPDEDYVKLPYAGPLQSPITSLVYTDYANTATTWTATNYIADIKSTPGRLVLAYDIAWPTVTLYPVNPICITYVCGYGTPDNVPEPIKIAMKIAISDMFENRESIGKNPGGSINPILDRLLFTYRILEF